jgi:hypothetical protein
VGVDQEALVLLHLLLVQHHLGELPDAGVDPVHDLLGVDLLLQHLAAALDLVPDAIGDLDLFPVAGDGLQLLDCE